MGVDFLFENPAAYHRRFAPHETQGFARQKQNNLLLTSSTPTLIIKDCNCALIIFLYMGEVGVELKK